MLFSIFFSGKVNLCLPVVVKLTIGFAWKKNIRLFVKMLHVNYYNLKETWRIYSELTGVNTKYMYIHCTVYFPCKTKILLNKKFIQSVLRFFIELILAKKWIPHPYAIYKHVHRVSWHTYPHKCILLILFEN